jgi:DNA-binding CsgD family transcriptional regulator
LLHGLVAKAADGTGGVMLVEGEQGIGKSALLRTVLQVTECRTARVSADDLGHAGVLARDPVAGVMGGLLALMNRWCAVSPVVLVVEDLQWADEASLLVWHQLSRAVAHLPMLLVGSCRPESAPEDLVRLRRRLLARGGTVVPLGPLADQEVSELAGKLVGGRPGRRLAELLDRAGGNPLYVRELAKALVREGRVRVKGGIAELAVEPALVRLPASLAGLIRERLGSLSEDAAGVLRWAAVLGVQFSVTDLEVVTGRSAGELIGVVDAAVTSGVVAGAGARLAFRHGLIRQALYEAMPATMRAALHLQAARALAGAGAAPERVALQLVLGAETVQASMAWSAWMVGWLADTAPTLIYGAPHVAAELLRGVMNELADSDPRREGLEAALVTAAFLLGLNEEVEQVGRQLLARVSDPDQAAEITWRLGYTLMRTGRPAEAAAAVADALARPGVGEAQAARLSGLQALILAASGQADRAAEVAADALAGAERAGDRFAAGYALHALSTVSFVRRDHHAIVRQTDRALGMIGDTPHTTDLRLLLLGNKAAALGEMDRRAEAIGTARQAVAIAGRSGTPRLGTVRFALADQFFRDGQWDEALTELEAVTDVPAPPYIAPMVHGLMALICGHRGEPAAADEHLRHAAAQPSRVALRPNGYYVLLSRALAAEQAGQPAAAAAVLAQCLRSGDAHEMPGRYLLLPALTRLALAEGDAGMAAAAAQAAEQEAGREPLPVKAAAADLCRGLLAGDPAPVLAAAAYYETAGRPFDRAAALEDAAVLAAARGDALAARQAFAGAIGLYGAVGAEWDIRRADARLRIYGIRRGRSTHRARPATGWGALTPTETKIAYLVAGGRSNLDIAAELFLSRNTVQTHVSHILAKLDARSRAEIVREALQQPPPHRDTRTAS